MATPRVFVLTAGGTREPIDDVRYVSNAATGQLPAELAHVLLAHGHTVHYIHGPGAIVPGHVTLDLPLLQTTSTDLATRTATWLAEATRLQATLTGTLHLHPIQTAFEVAHTLKDLCARLQPDAVACAMAVADFSPVAAHGKLSSRRDVLELRMMATDKAIDVVKPAAPRTHLLGFKLLSNATEAELIEAGQRLMARSGADLVFCNDMGDLRRGIRRGLLLGPGGEIVARLGDVAGVGTGGVTGLRTLVTELAHHGLLV